MISFTDLLMTINTLFIVGLCIHYFKSNYTIMDMETYNQVCDICEEYTAMVQEKEQMDDGGEGFFREYLDDEFEDEDDPDVIDPDEEEEDVKPSKTTKKRGRKAKKEEENKKVASDRKVGF